MRLINTETLEITEFVSSHVPVYGILRIPGKPVKQRSKMPIDSAAEAHKNLTRSGKSARWPETISSSMFGSTHIVSINPAAASSQRPSTPRFNRPQWR
jgi:hypothetical protein